MADGSFGALALQLAAFINCVNQFSNPDNFDHTDSTKIFVGVKTCPLHHGQNLPHFPR